HGGPMLWVDGTGRYTLTLGTGLSNYLVSGRAVVPGTWQHVAGTYDGTTARIYVNGQLAASVPFSGNIGDSSTWRIGAYGSSVFGAFGGTLDEVRIYNRALSAGEVATDMGAAPPSVDLPPSTPAGFAVTAATATTIDLVAAVDGRRRRQAVPALPRRRLHRAPVRD